MNEKNVRQSLDRQLSSVTWTQEDRQAVLQRIREENQPMKRKVSVGFVFALVIVMLSGVALAAGMGGMLEMIRSYVGNAKVLPEAVETLQHDLAYAENDYATYTVHAATFDGHQAFVLMEITAKDERALPLKEHVYPTDVLVPEAKDGKTEQLTIADFVKTRGCDRYVAVAASPDVPSYTSTNAWKDRSLNIFLSFAYEGDECPVTLMCSAVPYLDEETMDVDQKQSGEISFTLKAVPAKWTVESHESLEYEQSGLRVDSVRLYGTAMEVYYELTYTITDVEVYHHASPIEFVFLDASGAIMEESFGGEDMALEDKSGDTIVRRSSLNAMSDPPAALTLRIGEVTTDTPAFDEHQFNLK